MIRSCRVAINLRALFCSCKMNFSSQHIATMKSPIGKLKLILWVCLNWTCEKYKLRVGSFVLIHLTTYSAFAQPSFLIKSKLPLLRASPTCVNFGFQLKANLASCFSLKSKQNFAKSPNKIMLLVYEKGWNIKCDTERKYDRKKGLMGLKKEEEEIKGVRSWSGGWKKTGRRRRWGKLRWQSRENMERVLKIINVRSGEWVGSIISDLSERPCLNIINAG